MEIVVIIIFVCLAIAGIAYLVPKADPAAVGRPTRSFSQANSGAPEYEEEERAFEAALFKAFGRQNIEKYFYTKVVGITHSNEDGIDRETLLRDCEKFDSLNLVPEPDNPFDPNAVAVCLKDGRCLGYLNWRTAEEISRDIKHGVSWGAFVKYRKLPRKPHNGCLVLCMIQPTEGWVATQEAKYAGHSSPVK